MKNRLSSSSAPPKRRFALAVGWPGLLTLILTALIVLLLADNQTQLAYSFFQSPLETPETTATPLPTLTPLPAELTDVATPEPPASASGATDAAAQAPSPTAPPAQPDQPTPPQEVAPVNDSAVVINEVKLIDTLVQWAAWLWLCVGVGVILLIPIIFLFLQLRGSQLTRWK